MTTITYKVINELFKTLKLSLFDNAINNNSILWIFNTKEKKYDVIKFLENYGISFEETNNGYETDVLCIEYLNTKVFKRIIVS
jgi:hypothetical protein